jgi:hypothetical protein
MYRKRVVLFVIALVGLGLVCRPSAAATAAPAKADKPAAKPQAPRPAVEPDDGIQGEYAGTYAPAGGAAAAADAKVIGEGGGGFRVVLTAGEGEKALKVELAGKAEGKTVPLAGKAGEVEWKGTIDGGKSLAAESKDGKFDLKWAVRRSPTEGEKPPAGAVVLLPYEEDKAPSLDAWTNAAWKAMPDGSMAVVAGAKNNLTKQSFAGCRLHIEFMCPYMPDARGQARGNSGVYLQSRYEVQVLDSFGLPTADNECGGVYKIGVPKTNACLPPDRWQTYDVTFIAPEVQDGKITKPALLTVAQNGIKIHENVKVDHTTTAGVPGPAVSPAPLMLQDHGTPVRYRNIWLVELKD